MRRPSWLRRTTMATSSTPRTRPSATRTARGDGASAAGRSATGRGSAREGAAVSGLRATPGLPAAAQTEDGQEERGEEDLQADDDQRRGEHGEPLFRQLPEAALDPGDDDAGDDGEAGEQRDAAGQQPVLEPEARPHAVEPRVALAHEVRPVGMRAEAHGDD